jgi:hypothetical protein
MQGVLLYNKRKEYLEDKNMDNENEKYCECKGRPCITSGHEDDWGYWDVCVKCGRRIENGYHYYNHYDGEDHEDIDIW